MNVMHWSSKWVQRSPGVALRGLGAEVGKPIDYYCNDHALYNGQASTAVCTESGSLIGWNTNPYAPFLAAQSPDAVAIAMAQVAGTEPAKQAAEWMAANVPYFSTTAKPGAPNFKAWFDDWNRRNFPNGTATRPLTPAEILASVPMTVDANGNLVPVSSTTGGGSATTTGGGGSSSTGSGSTGATTPIIAGVDNTLLYAGAAGLVALILLMRK